MIGAVLATALMFAQVAPGTVSAPSAVTPAGAPGSAPAKPHSDVGTKVSRDQLLCKEEKVLGSLIPRKICYTRNEQEDREQQDHRMMDRLQSQFGLSCPPKCW
jgi:hypothetical protein